MYDGRTDPVKHVSHFNQRMVVHSKNEALMCKVFPSNLGSVAIRWFGSLGAGSIDSFKELTQEMFNEIDGDFDDMAIRTFKVDLPTEHGMRKFLIGKPANSVGHLMDRIDKYKGVEEDQQQGKGKANVSPQEMRDFRLDKYNNNRPQRDFFGHSGSATTQMVNTMFREPVHQVLDKIKNEPFFKWPNKMEGDPMNRNQSLHCQYHKDRGHTTEDCRTLWIHLEQLVREGRLKQFLNQPNGQGGQAGLGSWRDISLRAPLGTINVILVALRRTSAHPFRVMFVVRPPAEDSNYESKRAKMEIRPVLSFLDEDKVRTIQPHDDALVVTLRIRGYDVKRVLVDQGSGVEIMYPDLYKGLNLKPEDLTVYDSPLLGFDEKVGLD
ncbi:uncharacterized protein LOC111991723 [Quercus suber]|uniref:uncharacterized protein LOC111991723 n=1 Tax=Quercus suber TaxID=58331 RepID=UPI0032DE3CF1